MKKGLVLVLGLFIMSGGLLFAGAAKTFSGAFTLATSGGGTVATGSPRISFGLAPRSTEPTGLAGLGSSAIIENPDPPGNTAIGKCALYSNTTGKYNAACGYFALSSNTEGEDNAACGYRALDSNKTGGQNVACGSHALGKNTAGSFNVACGDVALLQNKGSNNTAIGSFAGYSSLEGNYNIFVGAWAQGAASDTNTIRIGSPYNSSPTPATGQNRTFISGIVESPFTVGDGPSIVGISSQGRLGTVPTGLLPKGPEGPVGPQGPPGEGLIAGSLLLLPTNIAPPVGYNLLGSTKLQLTKPSGQVIRLTYNVYQRQ